MTCKVYYGWKREIQPVLISSPFREPRREFSKSSMCSDMTVCNISRQVSPVTSATNKFHKWQKERRTRKALWFTDYYNKWLSQALHSTSTCRVTSVLVLMSQTVPASTYTGLMWLEVVSLHSMGYFTALSFPASAAFVVGVFAWPNSRTTFSSTRQEKYQMVYVFPSTDKGDKGVTGSLIWFIAYSYRKTYSEASPYGTKGVRGKNGGMSYLIGLSLQDRTWAYSTGWSSLERGLTCWRTRL